MDRRVIWVALGISLFIVCLAALTASAATWELTYDFSKNPARQDETITVTMTFKNVDDNQMKLEFLGIHFDWMEENYYYASPGTEDDPITLASDQTTRQTVSVSLTRDIVIVGYHSYNFFARYQLQDGWFDSWNEYTGSTTTKSDYRVLERDRDGDGVADSEDAFPDNPMESKDTDMDGVGDNADAFPMDPTEQKDTDGDGYGDKADAFPNNALEHVDSDSDGVGDNADAYPNDPKRTEEGDVIGTGSAISSVLILVIAVLIMIVLVIVIVFIMMRRKKTPTITQPQYSAMAPAPLPNNLTGYNQSQPFPQTPPIVDQPSPPPNNQPPNQPPIG